MKYDFFIASRWRNRDKVIELLNKLRQKGKRVYSFLDEDNSLNSLATDPEKAMQDFEAIKDWHQDASIRRIFEKDLSGLKQSKKLVLLLPAGKSAHLETGIAYGLGKECILIGEQKETESLYLIFNKKFTSVDDFIRNMHL